MLGGYLEQYRHLQLSGDLLSETTIEYIWELHVLTSASCSLNEEIEVVKFSASGTVSARFHEFGSDLF